MKATFLLPKDPAHQPTGDSTMASLLVRLAGASYETRVICLSEHPGSGGDGYVRIPKGRPRIPSLLVQSICRRRSLVHTRFAPGRLVRAVDDADTDIFVAVHSYLAEAVVRSRRFRRSPSRTPLAISTEVPEGPVWRARGGPVGLVEGHRIPRDEFRMAQRAYSVGAYDLDEVRDYSCRGIARAHWLDVTLPPGDQIDIANSAPTLVFVGNRTYSPNQQAYRTLLRRWPDIARGIAGAGLLVVGPGPRDADPRPLPAGVTVLGFVPDLGRVLSGCRALLAPISVGGGVRVKILDAARRGLPVVGSSAGIGSLSAVFDLPWLDSESGFIEQSRRYLLDRATAAADGDVLYGKNRARWTEGRPHAAVQDWLAR